MDLFYESTISKLTVDQAAMGTRCSELKVILTNLKESIDAGEFLELVAVEMKLLLLEPKSDFVDVNICFTAAELQKFSDANIVGSVES